MCTMIVEKIEIQGSGKGTGGWFALEQANVSYDHPFNAPYELALNIDFVDDSKGPGARVGGTGAWGRRHPDRPRSSGGVVRPPRRPCFRAPPQPPACFS